MNEIIACSVAIAFFAACTYAEHVFVKHAPLIEEPPMQFQPEVKQRLKHLRHRGDLLRRQLAEELEAIEHDACQLVGCEPGANNIIAHKCHDLAWHGTHEDEIESRLFGPHESEGTESR